MALAPSLPLNTRLVTDVNYTSTASLSVKPYLVQSGSTNALDLVQAVPYPTSETYIVNVFTAQANNMSSSVNINVALQHSSDNTTFTNIPELNPNLVVMLGAASTGSATQANVLLPPATKRYIRATYTTETSASLAGGITSSYGLQLFF